MRVWTYFLILLAVQSIVLNQSVIKPMTDSGQFSLTSQAFCAEVQPEFSWPDAAIYQKVPTAPDHLHENPQSVPEYCLMEDKPQRIIENLIEQQCRLTCIYAELSLNLHKYIAVPETGLEPAVPSLLSPAFLQDTILLI